MRGLMMDFPLTLPTIWSVDGDPRVEIVWRKLTGRFRAIRWRFLQTRDRAGGGVDARGTVKKAIELRR